MNRMTPNTVDLKGNDLTEIPESIYRCREASWLVFSNNSLRVVPAKLGTLKRITRLAFNDNAIHTVERGLGALRGLTWMDFTRNRLRDLPDDLSEAKKLTGLGLSENLFEKIPECVYSMSGLRKFGCFSNRISFLAPAVGRLQRLVKMDLSNNQLETLPDEVGQLSSLAWLNLSNNRLRVLPAGISRLTALEELGLGVNQLASLPDMGGLCRLRILPVFRNRLICLPGISRMAALEKLDCSDNAFSSFPNEALSLPALKYFNLRSNRIREISSNNLPIKGTTITLMDLSENLLESVPYKFLNLFPDFSTVRLSGNPFTTKKSQIPCYKPSLFRLTVSRVLNITKKPRRIFPIEICALPKFICDNCSMNFVTDPYIRFHSASFPDDDGFVLKRTLCSLTCYQIDQDFVLS